MTKYNHINQTLTPQYKANMAYFDSKYIPCLLLSCLVSCSPAYAEPTFNPTEQQLFLISSDIKELQKTEQQTEQRLLGSPQSDTPYQLINATTNVTNATLEKNYSILNQILNHLKMQHATLKRNSKTIGVNSIKQGIVNNTTPPPFSVEPIKKLIKVKGKNRLTVIASQGYDEILTKIHASGQTKPSFFGFFVPKICLDSQSSKSTDTNPHPQNQQGETVIFMMRQSSTIYDGMTLQNTIAFGRICRAVACVTESESRHPMMFHSVALTQNTQGGLHHA